MIFKIVFFFFFILVLCEITSLVRCCWWLSFLYGILLFDCLKNWYLRYSYRYSYESLSQKSGRAFSIKKPIYKFTHSFCSGEFVFVRSLGPVRAPSSCLLTNQYYISIVKWYSVSNDSCWWYILFETHAGIVATGGRKGSHRDLAEAIPESKLLPSTHAISSFSSVIIFAHTPRLYPSLDISHSEYRYASTQIFFPVLLSFVLLFSIPTSKYLEFRFLMRASYRDWCVFWLGKMDSFCFSSRPTNHALGQSRPIQKYIFIGFSIANWT